MDIKIVGGILIPFIGTSLGAACVLFLKHDIGQMIQRALLGFAAGVMTAASVWSLLIPAIEQTIGLHMPVFLPAAAGFWVGILFLLCLDAVTLQLPCMEMQAIGAKKNNHVGTCCNTP